MGPKADISKFNPFPGLRPFASAESDWFFGRDVEMEEIYTKLQSNRFVTLIGPPGCGKTSLINCGVVPLVKHHHLDEGSEWRVIFFRPGNDPIGNLSRAIASEASATGKYQADWKIIQSELFDNPDGIVAVLRKFISNSGEKILLVIDQFEELFRLASRGKKEIVAASVAKFVGLMVEVVKQPGENIFSIISLRSDFIGDCSRYHGLTQLINSSNYLVPELGIDNYRRAVEGPIVNAGAKIDPHLITQIIFDLGGRPDQLPVLQHTMMRTWTYWQKMGERDRMINAADYEAAGRLSNALADHAEAAYGELTAKGKKICEVMFKAITEKSQDNRGLRNPTSIATIKYIAACTNDELNEVLEKFRHSAQCFITPLYEITLTDDTVIDLSQEVLVKQWGRLQEWVDKEAASAQMYMRLSEASAMYQQGKTGLWKHPELQQGINWREQFNPTLAWAERYNPAFERAMVYLRTSEKKFIEEEANKIKVQKKRVRRIRIIASGLGIIAILALGYMFITIKHRKEADRLATFAKTLLIQAVIEKDKADSSSIVAIVQKDLADSAASIASRKAEEAYSKIQISESRRIQAEKEVAEALKLQSQALEQSDSAKQAIMLADQNVKAATEEKIEAMRLRMLSAGKAVSVKSILLQGQKELQALLAFQAYLFNKRNNGPENDADIYAGLYNAGRQNGSNLYRSFKGHNGDIRSIAFIPGRNEFFTSGTDGQVLKWSLNGTEKTFQVVYSGSDIINVLAVSPDAGWLACGSENSSIRMIALNGADKNFEMKGHKGKINSLVFSFDSRQLYSAALDGKVLKWEIAARTYTDVSTGATQITSIDISYNGSYLAGVRSDGTAVVWDPGKISDSFSIPTSGKNIKVVRFNPDKNILALGDAEGNIELWDITLHQKISEVKAHNGQVNDIRFNAKLNQMATAGNDKTLKIYNVKMPDDLSEPPVTLTDNDGFVFVIEFSPDSKTIIAGTSGGGENLVGRPTHVDFMASEICNYVSRNMNQDEWNTYVGKDIAYERTCQGKSFNIKIQPIR
jgi:WD40 repeat protein/energy-coupling factor transporter ATP-binding protein EcfA2